MKSGHEHKYYEQNELWGITNKKGLRIQAERADEILTSIPEEVNSVIDIGCGTGIITSKIKKMFVVGLDFARTPLKQLKKHKIQGSIDFLPIKSDKFDLVILNEVLEHLDDETYEAINEVERLKAKYILISVPFNENLEVELCKCSGCGNLFNLSHHYRKFGEYSFDSVFPSYDVVKTGYGEYYTPVSEQVIRLRNYFGIYLYFDFATCNKCGNPAVRPNKILGFVFKLLSLFDRGIKKYFLKIRKPYHLITLLRMKEPNNNKISKTHSSINIGELKI